ncbi:hypothetical protein Plim_3889 [Planctopirus limnophila DSM 3776]|uniref:Uncharacterized protein n=1 Tax=Planctopirus limnophila (strain ATCC 43296 / DSM 3776 / IFAM 1008 / Mu 290) TaxID=521674 RepID=D5SX79_PLAL2|nr:hypothetical protein Plim_3889 [Planctopirus limnophila DSM 3776]
MLAQSCKHGTKCGFTTKVAKGTKVGEENQGGGFCGVGRAMRFDAEGMMGGALLASQQWHTGEAIRLESIDVFAYTCRR